MSPTRVQTVDDDADWVERFADETPFHTPLKQINETHRRGLEVDDNDA